LATTYQQTTETKPADLILPAESLSETSQLRLQNGQSVRGPLGGRATLRVSAVGLVVDREDIRFQDVDFIWQTAPAQDNDPAPRAILRLAATRAEFFRCTFRCEHPRGKVASAVQWTHPSRNDDSDLSLPTGRIRFIDCSFNQVAACLDCRTIGAMAIEWNNVLAVNVGCFIQLDHCPRSDEPLSILLGKVTLRESGPLVECRMPRVENQPGDWTILATACAFAPAAPTPLVRVTGFQMPERFVDSFRWNGQGSLVTPQTPLITWRDDAGRETPVDESSLSMAGLVRSDVTFAADASIHPADSRLIRWQAPLQSADSPGANGDALPSGKQAELRDLARPGDPR
jgi:hypothetical protein